MKETQNLLSKQVTSNNMTGEALTLSHRSGSNSREHRTNSKHRSPNKFSQSNSEPYYGNSNFKPPSRSGSPYPRASNSQNNCNYTSRPKSSHYNRDEKNSQQPFSRNRLGNVRIHVNSLLDQEQTDSTVSNTENTDTQNVSEETLLEQQFNDKLLKPIQDNQDECFNCQEEGNTLTEE